MTPEVKYKIAFDLYFRDFEDQLFGGFQLSRALCAEPMAFLCGRLSTSWYCANGKNWPEHARNVASVSLILSTWLNIIILCECALFLRLQ